MTPQRWGLLALVLLALGLSAAYGLRGSGSPSTTTTDLKPLQAAAALEPCPAGLGPAFPDLTLPCLGGGPAVKLRAATPGRPTLVNVYGSWCGPCLREMPLLRQLHEKAKGRVGLVGIDTTEDSPARGLRFAKDVQQHWPALYDDDRSVGAHFGIAVPQTVFVTADGEVAYVEPGEITSLAELEALVKEHLGVTV